MKQVDPRTPWKFEAGPTETVRFRLADDHGVERWLDIRVDSDRLRVMGSHQFTVQPESANVVRLDVEFLFPLPACTGCEHTGVVEDLSSSLKYKRDRGEVTMRGCRRCHGTGVVRPHEQDVKP